MAIARPRSICASPSRVRAQTAGSAWRIDTVSSARFFTVCKSADLAVERDHQRLPDLLVLEALELAIAEGEMGLGGGGDGLGRQLLARLGGEGPVDALELGPRPLRVPRLPDPGEQARRLAPGGDLERGLLFCATRDSGEFPGRAERFAGPGTKLRHRQLLLVEVLRLAPQLQREAPVRERLLQFPARLAQDGGVVQSGLRVGFRIQRHPGDGLLSWMLLPPAPLRHLLLVSRGILLEQRRGLAELAGGDEIGGGREQRARHQRRVRLLLPHARARGQRLVDAPNPGQRRRGAEQRLVRQLAARVRDDEREQRLRLLRVGNGGVGKGIRALLLDAAEILQQRAVRREPPVREEPQRPAVDPFPVAAQVLDVEDQVRGVFGELVLGVRERNPGEVVAGSVVVARDVLQPARLERHLDGVGAVRERFQVQQAGRLELPLVGAQRALGAALAGVLLLCAAVERRLVARQHGAPGRLLQPASGFFAARSCRTTPSY